MSRVTIGFLIGVVVGTIASFVFSGTMFLSTKAKLVDQSRLIHLGMTLDDVRQVLDAEAAGIYETGTGLPAWAETNVPEDFWKSHGLATFYVGGFGPQLLLVYFDRQNRVVFVSHTHT